MEREQKKPFERWTGQAVYRSVIPSFGPNAHIVLGCRRGVIRNIYRDRDRVLHRTEWAVGVNWHTGEVTRGANIPDHDRFSAPFDYGLTTVFEMGILLRGGLLSHDGPCFNEPQPEELKKILPLYEAIISSLDMDWFPLRAKVGGPANG